MKKQGSLDDLVKIIHEEIREIVARTMRDGGPGHTLPPAELVSEAWLRLARGEPLELSDRPRFFGIVARTMRQILVEEARKRQASKRGDSERPTTLDDPPVSIDPLADVVPLHEALSALAHVDERKAKTAELFFFCGYTPDEIASMLDVHVDTVNRDLRFARAWAQRYLAQES